MSEDTIFREVDDELRSERMRALWRRFAPWVIGAAVLIVVLVAANEGWQWWQQTNAARSSDQFYSALEASGDGDATIAEAALAETIAEGSGDYPTLARFAQAGLLAAEGRNEEALAIYDALAGAQSNPRLRELALVLGASLFVDEGDVGAVNARIGGLLDPSNPMRNAARELLGLAQYRAGEVAAAAETFEQVLADPLASQELRGRVEIYYAQLMAQGLEDDSDLAAAPAEEAPAPAETEAPAEDAPAIDGVGPSDLEQFLAPAEDEPVAPAGDEPAEEEAGESAE